MISANPFTNIDEYLRERLMPAEGVIPRLPGIDLFGRSISFSTVGGDLCEFINFQQRYDIEARIRRAERLSNEFLEPLPSGEMIRNPVDDHVQWLRGTAGYRPEMETEYRLAKSLEQTRIAEELRNLYSTAGVLVLDAQGHGVISAEIASTVHSTLHALMLSELDQYGRLTPELFESINLRMALSVTARHELGMRQGTNARQLATMLYGEVRPGGQFRFVNFGHPAPLVFSAEFRKFVDLDESHMVHFFPLGLEIAAEHPDQKKYFSAKYREKEINSTDLAEITLMSPGDILVLYTDGVYDGADEEVRMQLENVMRGHYSQSAQVICDALLEHAVKLDELLRKSGDEDVIDDKTVLIVKRN